MNGQRWRAVIESVCLVLALVVGAAWPAHAQPGPVVTDYYHVDAVGSVRVVTDDRGVVVTRYDFAPFGEQDSPCVSSPDARLFTGHERDLETCLDYMGARYYRSTDGRFLTLDPALDASTALVDPQRWNRYAYANNNPTKYIDPDGREIAVLVGGRWVGAGLEAVPRSDANGNAELAKLGAIAVGALFGQPLVAGAVGVARYAFGTCLVNVGACFGMGVGIAEGLSGAPPGSVSGVAMRPDITLLGGRSGQLAKGLTGPANSAVRGGGDRVFITDNLGRVVLDITAERVKHVQPGIGFGPKRLPTAEELELLKRLWREP